MKKYARKKGTKSNKPWYHKKYSTYQIARKAYNAAKWIKSVVNVEYKKYDNLYNTTIGTTGTKVVDLTTIAQGSTDATRNGNSIKVVSLLCAGQVSHNVISTGTNVVRLLIVLDTQQVSDTSPSFADIVDSSFADDIHAPLTRATVGRFKVIRDRLFDTDPSNITKHFKMYIKLDHHMRFNGTTSTDIQKGGLYVFAVSNDNANKPLLLCNCRLTFVDN